ncbi:hypothetical protein MKK84_27360 [Methylobacterium sp. E-065]|uniref:hypothetical protein n=1 Tax=Methylobacterium sp. E-065 TaxID=2836583 RepID=UPI001FBA6D3C|nr:hypothetical protein [Methylobacterium sp. E-065]MCJ2021093.1 hypothetical protein [Methylobacterium sp. E-065]
MTNKNRPPQKLTREQIKGRSLGQSNRIDGDINPCGAATSDFKSAEDYSADKQRYTEALRNEIGSEAICTHPAVNPLSIMREADDRPMSAAILAKKACALIGIGHHSRVHEMLIVAYYIALKFILHDHCYSLLASEISDARYTNGPPVVLIKKNFLHYLFLYIFYQSGMESRDRATQYAQSLQYYFDLDTPLAEVDRLLKKHGQNNLRKAAQYRAKILAGAREWLDQGGDPTSVTMEEVLEALVKDREQSTLAEKNGAPLIDSDIKISAGDQRFKPRIDEISGDAEWLEANDPARNPDASYDDEHNQSELLDDISINVKSLEQTKILCEEMLTLTARMIDNVMTFETNDFERDAMLTLIRQSWVKLMMLHVRINEPHGAPLDPEAT